MLTVGRSHEQIEAAVVVDVDQRQAAAQARRDCQRTGSREIAGCEAAAEWRLRRGRLTRARPDRRRHERHRRHGCVDELGLPAGRGDGLGVASLFEVPGSVRHGVTGRAERLRVLQHLLALAGPTGRASARGQGCRRRSRCTAPRRRRGSTRRSPADTAVAPDRSVRG